MKYRVALFPLLWIGTGLLSTTAPAAEPRELRAGPLSMLFDSDNAFLRFVRIGKHEILRGINAPVRNRFWGTVQPKVTNLEVTSHDNKFTVTFDASCREREVDFFWKGRIDGNAKGEVVFTFDGEARSTFLRNRIGFCILHGPSAAGKQWKIKHVSGKQSDGQFPDFISPHQPAKDIRMISHHIAADVWAHVRCEGDIFEMEDQRNWTDASFKTYCTPLDLPRPVRIAKGTKISHRVQISVTGDASSLSPESKPGAEITLALAQGQENTHPLPRIGLRWSPRADVLGDDAIGRLKALNLDHIRIDLTPSTERRRLDLVLSRAKAQAEAVGVSLHAGLHLRDDPAGDLKRLADALESTRPPVSVWIVVAANRATLQLAHQQLRAMGQSTAVIGSGEDTNFTELNRSRQILASTQLVSFGANPQCHAYDNLTMIENLEIQADAVRSARQFTGDRSLLVGPITLRTQSVSQAPLPGELPSNVDARQPSLFVAGWTLGSVKYLAESAVDYLTYYETVGWKGVMESKSGSLIPAAFPSTPGEVFAVYHVLRDIGQFAGGQVRRVDTTDNLSVVGLALEKDGRTRLMLANLTHKEKPVVLRGLSGQSAILSMLDGTNIDAARSEPEVFSRRQGRPIRLTNGLLRLRLPAHGIARIDGAR